MEQLPKIVRERLQASERPGLHPDPDLLTAFAEHSLTERERAPVLEHLSSCFECRELVALAQPEFAIEQVAAAAVAASPASSRPRWSSRLMFSWAMVSACVVIGAVLLRYQTREKKFAQIASKPAEPTLSVGPTSNPEKSSAEAESEAETETKTGTKTPPPAAPQDELAAKLEAPAPPQSKSTRASNQAAFGRMLARPMAKKLGAGAASRQIGGAMALRAAPQIPLGSAQVTASGEAVETTSDTTASVDKTQAELPLQARSSAEKTASQSLAAAAAPPAAQTGNQLAVPNPAPSGAASRGGAIGSAAAFSRQKETVETAQAAANQKLALARISSNYVPARWTISSDGTTLLHSTDEGRSWDAVNVADNLVFRAVAALGPEVWVGGKAGALYHSSDLGAHWTQVKPTANGTTLTADIVSLDFTDREHGKVATAEGKLWTTNDGGKTWQTP